MKVLCTGANGQLGRSLLTRCPEAVSIVGVDLPDADITEADEIEDLVGQVKPDVIVNAAAWTAVDLAETEEHAATRVNVDGPANLAKAAGASRARLIHISTDFVFDGCSETPYAPDAEPSPLSVYGKTKLEGEQRVLARLPDRAVVLRTAWLYSEFGGNFLSTMLRLMGERDELGVVQDQVGSPTWAGSVADAIFAFVMNPDICGIYHWTDSGQASWYDFACAIQEEACKTGRLNKKITVKPILSADFPTAAARPAFSVLDCSATETATGLRQTPWRQNVKAIFSNSEVL